MKKFSIWWLEDDDMVFKVMMDGLKFKDMKVKRFINGTDLSYAVGSPDIIILDVSGIFGGGISLVGCWDTAFSIIKHIADSHPGAVFGLYSAVGVWASHMIEELMEESLDAVMEQIAFDNDDKELLSINDFIARYKGGKQWE